MEPIIRSNILEAVHPELADQLLGTDDKLLEKIDENEVFQSSGGMSQEPVRQVTKSDETYNLLHSQNS